MVVLYFLITTTVKLSNTMTMTLKYENLTPSDKTKINGLTVAVLLDSTQIHLINIEKLSLSRTIITDDNVLYDNSGA